MAPLQENEQTPAAPGPVSPASARQLGPFLPAAARSPNPALPDLPIPIEFIKIVASSADGRAILLVHDKRSADFRPGRP